MKEVFGSPGKISGLVMRVGQCLFASASSAIMLSAPLFSRSTAFCSLVASMGWQATWSLGLACLDIHALRLKRNIRDRFVVSLLLVGDWVTSILSLASACSSAGVVVWVVRDTTICITDELPCKKFQLSVALAFLSWFFLAISSNAIFWFATSG